ncbi:PIEZ1 protein, partial [Agelaius phoeniceus]|nr:PIEZ1 protein [Agelaius phoeniceus]
SSPRAGSVPRLLMAPVPLQLAYQAWVTNTRTVLRQQEQPEQPQPPSTESTAERSNVLQRALSTLRFLWLLCQALVDGLTQWLDTQTREHTDMSQVLCLERFVMAERLAKVSPGGTPGHGGWQPTGVALTSCLPQGEQINEEEFPNELYELPPEELLQEPSPPGSLAAVSLIRASRQVHRYPRGDPWQYLRAAPSSGSQEQGISVEDVADAQQFLAVPQQRRRTASELLRSR